MSVELLEKSLDEYYNCLHRVDEKFKSLFNDVETPLNSLKNEMQQLRLVSVDSLDKSEICTTREDFRAKLIFKIIVAMEDELSLITEVNTQLNNHYQGLRNKFDKLEAARSNVDLNKPGMKQLIIGTPDRPRLDLLLEWAIETSRYYAESCSSINKCVKKLDFKEEETLNDLIDCLKVEKSKRGNVDVILAFTRFMVTK